MNINATAEQYVDRFFGYGNPAAKLWFVGMEEAGVSEPDDFIRRLDAWNAMGRGDFIDAADFHRRIAELHLFEGGRVKVQRTWRKLIRTFLKANGREVTEDSIRAAQKNEWGRLDSGNCLTELYPLPAAKASDWPYSDLLTAPHFSDRKTYMNRFGSSRAGVLREKISAHRPCGVVFYSSDDWYIRYWNEIVGEGAEWSQDADHDYLYHERDGAIYVIVRHPTAWGATNAMYDDIGDRIARLSA